MKDDFEESVLGSGDCQHWRTALERRGVDEATIAELSTAGQALVATVNSAPAVGIAEQTPGSSILESTLYYLGQGTTTASSVGSSSGSVFLSELTQNDFREYLVRNGDALEAFERNRERRKSELEASGSINGGHGGHCWEQGQGLVESMKTVPHMFFREEYDLSDAETYARALGSSGVGNLGGSEGEQEWAEAIEKLSLYVDDVEVNLLREVQARAHQFLDATGTITALQRAISQACVAIGSARRGLRQNERATSGAMAAMRRLRGEREALEAVLSLATALEDCHHATEALRLLLPQRDYASILDVMGSLERSLGDGGEHGGVGASGLRCVAGALKKMEQTRAELIGDMSADFVRLGLGSVGHPQRPGGGLGGGGAELVDAMLPLVLSLHRTGALADAIKSFYDTLEHRLKSGAPELLWELGRREAEAGEDEAGEGEDGHGDGDLRDLVSGLALDSYLRVQSRMVKELRTWARSSLGSVRMAVEAALKESFFVYSQGFDSMADCLEDSVASFWVRVLQMRQACHRSLKLSEFLRHVSATRGELGGDQGGGRANGRHGVVRNALNAQCKSYLEVVHKYCKTKVVSALQVSRLVLSLSLSPATYPKYEKVGPRLTPLLFSSSTSTTSGGSARYRLTFRTWCGGLRESIMALATARRAAPTATGGSRMSWILSSSTTTPSGWSRVSSPSSRRSRTCFRTRARCLSWPPSAPTASLRSSRSITPCAAH